MKEFLSRNGIEFTVKDIHQDPAAIQDLQRLGVLATPVTVVDGGQPVVGFNQPKLRELLGIAG